MSVRAAQLTALAFAWTISGAWMVAALNHATDLAWPMVAFNFVAGPIGAWFVGRA